MGEMINADFLLNPGDLRRELDRMTTEHRREIRILKAEIEALNETIILKDKELRRRLDELHRLDGVNRQLREQLAAEEEMGDA